MVSSDKNHLFFGLINAEKQLHLDFKSARVCYFNIYLTYVDLGMSSLSNKWQPFF